MTRNNKIRLFAALTLLLTTISGCGPLIDETYYPWYVVDEKQKEGGESGDVTPEIMFGEVKTGMQYMLDYNRHKYQYIRANSIDVYAGYMAVNQRDFLFGGPLPTTYTYPNPYSMGPVSESLKLFPTIKNAYFHAERLGYPEFKAIVQIMYAYSMQEIVDFYGAVPFDDYRNLKQSSPIKYEPQDEVYKKILAELKEAIDVLKKVQPSKATLAKIEHEQGGLSGGDWKRWVKFANSLRLRMAMNMVKVNPAEAQQIAEQAVNDNIGALTYTDEDIAFTNENSGQQEHPLWGLSVGWDDTRLGASLLSVLKHFNNPLLEVWFTKNYGAITDKNGNSTGIAADQDYLGIRQGIATQNKNAKQSGYSLYSAFNLQYYPRSLIKVTEVLFIKSEGALRGWNMGSDAQTLYSEGIRKSFEENNVGNKFDDYINQDNLPAADHFDPYDQSNNMEGRVKVGVKWNESDGNELKLEKIITQKYIANFPMGAEAWTTFRRTGYPRLFPVRFNNWATVDTELQLRRLPYLVTTNNQADIQQWIGSKNAGGERVWWDVATETKDANGQIVPNNF